MNDYQRRRQRLRECLWRAVALGDTTAIELMMRRLAILKAHAAADRAGGTFSV